MTTLICLNKTWKLAFSASLLILLPVIITAQTPDPKEVLPREEVQHPGQVCDSTAISSKINPGTSIADPSGSKESEKKDTTMIGKKDSFTPSQDEWLKNAGYFKSNKVSASKKSRRNPELKQSAEVVNERND